MAKEDEDIASLEKKVGEITEQLEKALKAAGEDGKNAAALQKQLDELSEKLEKQTADNAVLKAVAALPDVEKAWYDNLKSKGKKKANGEDDEEDEMFGQAKKFLEMSSDDRKKLIAKHEAEVAKGDETLDVNGTIIRKSEVGAAQFAIIKSQQAEITANKDAIAKANDKALVAELTKVADDQYAHILGKTEDKVEVLKAIRGLPEKVRTELEKLLGAADKVMKMAFDKVGHDGEKSKPGSTEFEKKAAEIQSRDKCSGTDAFTKARTEHPDLFKAYQEAGKEVVQN